MEAYSMNNPLWEMPRADSFTQLADDDFLALLQKQFPTIPNNSYDYSLFPDSINPQSITTLALPTATPPSEESSPSPPSNNDSDEHETPLKRKASANDDEVSQPNTKSQHTLANDKKGASANVTGRRKVSGPDEARQLKRKEQNRAAQRAFRERKEKHVKDLEDKVSELQAKNEQAASENENLRDLLSRLQNENMMLKQASFTFSVPKTAASQPSMSSVMPDPSTAMATDNLDWGSLTTFDPAVLSLLDDSPSQPTATDGAMQMDFGFGTHSFTTIASNPSFMSFASSFDDPPSDEASASTPPFSFNSNASSSWTLSPPPTTEQSSLDDLFSSCGPIDFQTLIASTPSISRNSVSPVQHRSPSSSASSPSSILNTPKDLGSSCSGDPEKCPKTKEQCKQHIANQGPSMFAPSPNLTIKDSGDSVFGPTIMCQGSSFPKTAKSDSNVPVLSAWRTITSNPEFKDADINELCAEFTSKARCDGTKVVLEPQGVHHIMETFSKKKKGGAPTASKSSSDLRL